jgi:hypothetical protein
MSDILAFTIFALIFTVGEYVAYKTKANIDVVLFVAVALLIGFWVGLPSSIYEKSGIMPMAGIIITLLIVGMGNMIDFAELKRQWKTVCVSIIALTAACFALVFVGQYIIGRDMVLAGTPVFGGGTAATIAMKTILVDKGREDLSVYITLLLGLQSLVGIPVSSQFLKRAGVAFKNNKADFELYSNALIEEATSTKKRLIHFPASLDRPSFHLMKLGAVGVVSYYFSVLLLKYTGVNVSYIIVALIMGTIFTELGFLDPDTLGKTDSSGFILFACVIILFSDFATCSPSDVLALIKPMAFVLLVGTFFGCITGFICGKIFRVEPNLAIVMCLTCMYGFPATMYLSLEVAEVTAENETERKIIENYLLPKMNIAGFVTGSFATVLAGIFGGML